MKIYGYNNPMVQATDWLAVSVLFDDLPKSCPGGHHWVCYERGTNVWQDRRILYNEYGQPVLTLLAKPKSTIINPHAGLVEVSNEWLYHGVGAGKILSMLRHFCEFSITGLSRLDLCMDFTPTDEMSKIIRGLATNDYYIVGKRNGSGFWSMPKEDYIPEEWRGKCPHCQSWGHKSSQVKWKLYYKSKELRDAGGGWFDKPYIVDAWRVAGLDINNAWRLEVSIHDCNSLVKDGDIVNWDTWQSDELAIFTAMYRKRFQVARNEGHADKTNDTRVRFLPIDTLGQVRNKQYEGNNVNSARITLLRHLVKDGEQPEVYADRETNEALINHVRQLVNRDHLQLYFMRMTGMSIGEWECYQRELIKGRVENSKQIVKNTDIQPNMAFS